MKSVEALRKAANENRHTIIDMIYQAGVGHPGGSLSVIDLLTAVYELDVDFQAEKAGKPRSKVILSKGHAVPAQYAILYAKGFIGKEELSTFRGIDSRLQGHPSLVKLPQVDATTGLLGQGLSLAIGTALAKRENGDESHVYAILGDGEMSEGQIWEALLQGAHFGLDRLVVIVDNNKLSSSGCMKEVLNIESVAEKLRAFHYNTLEIDGHNMDEIVAALQEAWSTKGKPTAIVAHTVKGKGVSFMENQVKWHSLGLTEDEYKQAMEDLAKEVLV